MGSLESTVRLFRRIDRLFWCVWLAYVAMLWVSIGDELDPSRLQALMKVDVAGCVASLPLPANFSLAGKMLFWSFFGTVHLFFCGMLAVVHLAIHRFARGQIFVHRTLEGVRYLGFLIVGLGIYESVVNNGLIYGLYLTGDVARFQADYSLDVPTLAVGVFILTFKFILERAITLQEDVDLTI